MTPMLSVKLLKLTLAAKHFLAGGEVKVGGGSSGEVSLFRSGRGAVLSVVEAVWHAVSAMALADLLDVKRAGREQLHPESVCRCQ